MFEKPTSGNEYTGNNEFELDPSTGAMELKKPEEKYKIEEDEESES